MPGRDPPLVDFESAGYLDAAETFGESDLTLSHTDTEVAAESIRILNHYGTTASQPGGSYTASNDEFGLVINPNTALDGIRVTAAPNTSGVTEIVVAEADTNNELASATGLSFGSGDTVTIPVSLDASTEYAVYAENGTQDDNRSASYPYTSGDVDIVNGWNNGGTISNAGTFSEVTAYFKESDGTSYLGWPHPSDVYRWDSVLFQRSPDGETVEVYIEESTDGGSTWTTIAGPISRGQEITADPSSEVRLRVELSRSSTANNPTLDAAYRRYIV